MAVDEEEFAACSERLASAGSAKEPIVAGDRSPTEIQMRELKSTSRMINPLCNKFCDRDLSPWVSTESVSDALGVDDDRDSGPEGGVVTSPSSSLPSLAGEHEQDKLSSFGRSVAGGKSPCDNTLGRLCSMLDRILF